MRAIDYYRLEQYCIERGMTCVPVEVIKSMADVEAEPVVHAHWDMTYETCGAFETTRTYYYGHCSRCKRRVEVDCLPWGFEKSAMEDSMKLADKKFPYCHCGAKMDEVE